MHVRTKEFNWIKYLLNIIFVSNFLYGVFILKYFVYMFKPQWADQLMLYTQHIYFYFHPLLNKIAFLLHILGGSLALMLAPFVFIAAKRDSVHFKILTQIFLFSSLLVVTFWPLIVLFDSTGVSMGLYLVLTLEVLICFLLAKTYYFYKIEDRYLFMTYFIYLYSGEVATGWYRIIHKGFSKIYPIVVDSTDHLIFNPNNLSFDLGFFFTIVAGVLLAKILMYFRVIDKY